MESEEASKICLVQRYRYTPKKTKQYQHQSQRRLSHGQVEFVLYLENY